MSTEVTRICDRCGKRPINEDYTLTVHVQEHLPASGGFTTGWKLNRVFDFCGECQRTACGEIMEVLNRRGGPTGESK